MVEEDTNRETDLREAILTFAQIALFLPDRHLLQFANVLEYLFSPERCRSWTAYVTKPHGKTYLRTITTIAARRGYLALHNAVLDLPI